MVYTKSMRNEVKSIRMTLETLRDYWYENSVLTGKTTLKAHIGKVVTKIEIREWKDSSFKDTFKTMFNDFIVLLMVEKSDELVYKTMRKAVGTFNFELAINMETLPIWDKFATRIYEWIKYNV